MRNESGIISGIKNLWNKISAQLERNPKAGQPVSRQQAMKKVLESQQRDFKLRADKSEQEGNEDAAEFACTLSELLPGLIREFGLHSNLSIVTGR
jgi:hypothetical protein